MDLMRLLMLSASIVMLGLECEGAGRLSYDFYKESCPQVENIVREGVHSASIFDPTTSAALLRLLFHDCQVQVSLDLSRTGQIYVLLGLFLLFYLSLLLSFYGSLIVPNIFS